MQKGSHAFTQLCAHNYKVAAFPSVSVLFSHYPGASNRLHTTGLLLKVMTKCKASVLPPCGIKAAKDTASDPTSAASGHGVWR